MKYSQIRIALLTFALGIASVPFFNVLSDKWNEPSVNLPKVVSRTPIIVDIETAGKPHWLISGGGASGGQTCDDFFKSLGKLTKKSLIKIAESPCHDLRSIQEINNKSFQK